MKKDISVTKINQAKRKDGTPVEGVNSKTGSMWTLYKIWDEEGKNYAIYGDKLNLSGIKEGDRANIEYTTKKEGKYTNYFITRLWKADGTIPQIKPEDAPNSAKNDKFEVLVAQLDRIEGELGELQAILLNKFKE